MRKLTLIANVVVPLTVASIAQAVSYNPANSDLLLVFRKTSSKDMVYSIGSVSNYLNVAAGTTVPVTGYSTNQVYTNFNNSFSGISCILAATTSDSDPLARVWLTDADQVNAPSHLTVNGFATLNSKVTGVGNQATFNTGNNASTPFVIAASADSSYTFIVSDNNSSAVNTWDGNVDFVVETTSGNSLKFYELHINPGGGQARFIGTFSLASNGILTFARAGGAVALSPSTITTITSSGNTRTIYFTTTNNASYRLVYATTAATNADWTQLPGSVAGDGTVKSLSDTSTEGRFYRVQTY